LSSCLPILSSIALLLRCLIVWHLSARRSGRTQIVPKGAKIGEQILRFRENRRLLRLAHEQDDYVVATRAHSQHERIETKRLATDVGVRDARSIKHIVRHVHGHGLWP